MCDQVTLTGIAIGAAVGATTSAITGQDPLMGALLGGAAGGFFTGSFGVGGSIAGPVGGGFGLSGAINTGFGSSIAFGGLGSATAMGLAGGTAMNMLSPQQPDYSQFGYGAQPYETSSQPMTVTGSGGRQAAAVLAEEVIRAKSLRSRQAGTEDYGLGMATTGTGLQIA